MRKEINKLPQHKVLKMLPDIIIKPYLFICLMQLHTGWRFYNLMCSVTCFAVWNNAKLLRIKNSLNNNHMKNIVLKTYD